MTSYHKLATADIFNEETKAEAQKFTKFKVTPDKMASFFFYS